MTLLSRLRSRAPQAQDPRDANLEAVHQLNDSDQDRLGEIARQATSAQVRRAATRRLTTPSVLGELLGDSDEAVREEAGHVLVALACGESDLAAPAASALKDTRHLLALARGASLPPLRHEALGRLEAPHALTTLAKTAPDPSIRMEALARIQDPELILSIALKSEHKDSAVASLERIEDDEKLRLVASSETSKAARRARVRLQPPTPKLELEPPQETPQAAPQEPPQEKTEASAPAPPEPKPEPRPAPPSPTPREDPRKERLARAEALCTRLEAEAVLKGLRLAQARKGLREAKDEMALDGLPPTLLRRLKAVRAALFARTQELREAEEWKRWADSAIQEELCRRLEALLSREDYPQVTRELDQADHQWSQLQTHESAPLRQRYQDARQKVKARLQAFFAKKKEEEAAHRLAKEELCSAAESLANSGDWLSAANALKELQTKWKTIGPTSRRDSEELWKRFRAACDQFFSRRDEDRKRRRAEWSANLGRKEALCEKAEALSTSSDWEATASELRKLQTEWKAIGPVRRSQSERVWQRFRGACDRFFERYKVREDLAQAQVLEEREADCRALEGLTEPPADLPTLVQQTFARAAQKPLATHSDEARLMERLQAARVRLVEAFPESFRGTELDPEANRTKREKLCERIEAVAAELEGLEGAPVSTQDLARRLKEALAARTIGGASEVESRRKTLQEEAQAARSHWERLGSVVGEQGRALEKRFQAALARVPMASARPRR